MSVRLCQVTSVYIGGTGRAVIQLAQAVIQKKVKIVSVHVRYFSFFQFLQFRSVSLSQVTSGYIRLRQFTLEGWDVELDNMKNNTDIKISYLQAESLQININCLHWSLNLNRSVYWL